MKKMSSGRSPQAMLRTTYIVAGLITANAVASAADAPQEAPPLEEIIVTAQKRSEKLSDVPASISAIDNRMLVERGLQDINDFATYTPGLTLTGVTSGLGQITLRGVSSGSNAVSAAVGVYVDESPVGSSRSCAVCATGAPEMNTFDMQRIEVLRGPQGTLYGASTLGGLVKYVTTPPDLQETVVRTELTVGSAKNSDVNYSARAAVNLPIVDDKLAVRVNGYHRLSGGYVENIQTGTTNEHENSGGRVSLLWQATDDVTVRLTSLVDEFEGDSADSVAIDPVTRRPVYGDLKNSQRFDETVRRDFELHNLTVEFDLQWARLLSSTSYSDFESRNKFDYTAGLGGYIGQVLAPRVIGTSLPNNIAVNLSTPLISRRFVEEVRLTSPDSERFEWQLGVFYTKEDSNMPQGIDTFVPGGAPLPDVMARTYVTDRPSRFRELAGFADVNIHFAPQFDIGLGIRTSDNELTSTVLKQGPYQSATSPTQVFDTPMPDQNETTSTYSIRPRWRPTDDLTIYGVASSGYRPGGSNAPPPAGRGIVVPPTFESDELWNYELGVKTSLLDQQLVTSLSAFYIDWSNMQVASVNNGFGFLGNGGKAKSQGFEWEATLAVADHLTLGANAAYTDAELLDDAAGVGGRKGDRLPLSAEWAGALNADYEMPVSAQWNAALGASYRYVGERNSGFSSDPGYPNIVMPSYGRVDLRASLDNDRWSLRLLFNNVLDKRAYTNIYPTLVAYGAPANAFVIEPRTIMLQLVTTL